MIFVDRSKQKPPPFFHSKQCKRLINKAKEFYNRSEKEHSQYRFDFQDINTIPKIRDSLLEAFNWKCAYTEAPLSMETCTIIRHRPRSGAIGIDNSPPDRDHYWWLAYEWNNMIPVLSECARSKSHYFPVEGQRAKIGMPLNEVLQTENPLLLDPCVLNKQSGLMFKPDGIVQAQSQSAQFTIELLNLNSSNLVKQRHDHIKNIENSAFIDLPSPKSYRHLINTILDKDGSFLELSLQWILEYLETEITSDRDYPESISIFDNVFPNIFSDPNIYFPENRVLDLKKRIIADKESQNEAREPQTRTVEFTETISLVESVKVEIDRVRPLTIERIEIKNFKTIDRMTVDMAQTDPEHPSGLMIIGENGSGKSSVLQAITLALLGPKRVQDIPHLSTKKVLRRGATSKEGFVSILLSNQTDPIIVRFQEEDDTFHYSGPIDQLDNTFFHAYGPHRLLPRYDQINLEGDLPSSSGLSVLNLWDPYEPLVDAEKWISKMDDPTFDMFIVALRDLLNLQQATGRIERDDEGKLLINGDSLEDLSAGYRSIIGTASDIIAGYPSKRSDMQIAQGIVMIDEIGAHLHPSWRMRIVNAYRKTFPNIQFLTTTHEPLCLRGVRQEEILVLRREGGKVLCVENLPNLGEMRIDQILTSPVFGMDTTVDPEAEEDFKLYYSILSNPAPNMDEEKQAEELKKKLYRYGVLGNDRRARAIYDIIDHELAKQPVDERGAPINKKTKERVLEIWNNSGLDF